MRRSRIVLLVLSALACWGLVVASASAASAAPPSYVALGDSYSSGVGTRSYLADGSSCQRSVYAYPSLLAAARGYALTFRACSGATVADVTALQLDALGADTAYVTVSVGGNDAGFASTLSTCALPSWLSNCSAAVTKARGVITGQLPSRLATLYASIRARAPRATVVVVGYPRIFNGTDCNALTWFSAGEETKLNATADLLAATTRAAATTAGFQFVDAVPAFGGHAVCDRTEWINGLSAPISESYHPNRAGQASGYLPLVGAAITGAPVVVSADVLARAAASTDALAAQQRAYAGRDAAITPKSFLPPAPSVGR